jgi:hypothetical protein
VLKPSLTYAEAVQTLVADGLTSEDAAAYIDAWAESEGRRRPPPEVPRGWIWRALHGRRRAGVSRLGLPSAA